MFHRESSANFHSHLVSTSHFLGSCLTKEFVSVAQVQLYIICGWNIGKAGEQASLGEMLLYHQTLNVNLKQVFPLGITAYQINLNTVSGIIDYLLDS